MDQLISLDELISASEGTDVKVIFAEWYAPNGGVATTRPGGLNVPSDFVAFLLEGKNGIAEG